ncbi:MAG: hypothetical protein WCG27_03350 [Pseudomonadota bacterium]
MNAWTLGLSALILLALFSQTLNHNVDGQFLGNRFPAQIKSDIVAEKADPVVSPPEPVIKSTTFPVRDYFKLMPDKILFAQAQTKDTNLDFLETILDEETVQLLIGNKVFYQKEPRPLLELMLMWSIPINAYLAEGFIYDPKGLREELKVFRQQLKHLLKSIPDPNANNGENNLQKQKKKNKLATVEDLYKFFVASGLSDQILIATLAQEVRLKLLKLVDQKELADPFKNGQGYNGNPQLYEWSCSAGERFRYMRQWAKVMTQHEQIKRIFSNYDPQGQEDINFLKSNYLLPKMFGRPISEINFKRAQKIICKFLARDTGRDGLVERLTGEEAQFYLKAWWALEEHIFNNQDHYQWENLRKTPEGIETVKSYAENILFPELMGLQFDNNEKRRRVQDFQIKLRKAVK